MDYNEFQEIYDREIDRAMDSDECPNLTELTEWYETQLELQDRPRKPDVINNVSINSPYDIDLNEYKDRWAKYEKDHASSLASFSDEKRIENFMVDRHGYLKKYPYLYDNRLFDMPFDLALYIYCVDHDWDIEFKPGDEDYAINGKPYYYIPAHLAMKRYSIMEKTTSEAVILSESSDFNKEVWDWMYDNYSDGYVPLFRIGIPFPWPNQDFRDTSPSGLIRHFHKSIYTAHYRGQPSSIDVWDDKEVFKRLAINRLKYVGQVDLVTMLHGLNIAKEAIKVSVFKPTLATELIKTYLFDAKNIFDPFSGFSGRMFGAINNGIPYIGRDVSEEHVNESKQIIEFINANPQIKKRYPNIKNVDLDVANAITNRGAYDCLLTCPPYATYEKGVLSNIEEWNNPNQEILTCDQWIDVCLQNYKCRKYLFVVDDSIVKYRNFIVGNIGNKGHMGRNTEFLVFIDFTNYWNGLYFNPSGSYGLTPFDIDQSKEYSDPVGPGVTPFDI